MKLFYFAFLLAAAVFLSGCSSINLAEPYASDFSSSGPLGDDCFQVVIKVEPEKDAVTMHERRESAFIKAKKNIYSEAERQIVSYYLSQNGGVAADESANSGIRKKAASYADSGKLEHEFYLNDDSVVLIYRIYKKGIKDNILNK